jgi:hypothetical protein
MIPGETAIDGRVDFPSITSEQLFRQDERHYIGLIRDINNARFFEQYAKEQAELGNPLYRERTNDEEVLATDSRGNHIWLRWSEREMLLSARLKRGYAGVEGELARDLVTVLERLGRIRAEKGES